MAYFQKVKRKKVLEWRAARNLGVICLQNTNTHRRVILRQYFPRKKHTPLTALNHIYMNNMRRISRPLLDRGVASESSSESCYSFLGKCAMGFPWRKIDTDESSWCSQWPSFGLNIRPSNLSIGPADSMRTGVHIRNTMKLSLAHLVHQIWFDWLRPQQKKMERASHEWKSHMFKDLRLH